MRIGKKGCVGRFSSLDSLALCIVSASFFLFAVRLGNLSFPIDAFREMGELPFSSPWSFFWICCRLGRSAFATKEETDDLALWLF